MPEKQGSEYLRSGDKSAVNKRNRPRKARGGHALLTRSISAYTGKGGNPCQCFVQGREATTARACTGGKGCSPCRVSSYSAKRLPMKGIELEAASTAMSSVDTIAGLYGSVVSPDSVTVQSRIPLYLIFLEHKPARHDSR